jgi:uncharacterized protein YjcR
VSAFDDWPEIMKVKDIVDHLEVKRDTVYQWLRSPTFPKMTDDHRNMRVGKFALRAWINRGCQQ